MLLDDKAMLLIEFKSLLVVALHVKHHSLHVSCHHAVLDGLLEELGGDAVATIGFKDSDRHDITLLTILINVFFAGDGTD